MNQENYKIGRRTNNNFCIQNWRNFDIINNNHTKYALPNVLQQSPNLKHLKEHYEKNHVTQVFRQNNILLNSAYKFQYDQNSYDRAYNKITQKSIQNYDKKYNPKQLNSSRSLGQFAIQMERALTLDVTSKQNSFTKQSFNFN